MRRTALQRKTPLRSRAKHAKKRKKLGHAQLWPLVSRYVRDRDRGICFTCGKACAGSNYHAGHFIPSSVGGYALRYHPLNLAGQCYHDNINLGGWGERFAERLEARHGADTVRELRKLVGRQFKIDWEAAVDYFRDPPIANPIVLPFVTEV